MEIIKSFNKTSYFIYCLAIICIAYLLFEFFYIPFEALGADEFVFARHIYEYTFHLPYRDFAPYKTVLGYYLLTLPLFFSHTLLQPLYYIKDEIALINVICIVLSCYWATRLFDKNAVLLSLLAIIGNQSFLSYASELRVDMLTSWVCLFAAFAVLQKRCCWGGILLGLAFLISQKALWYVMAIDGAMAMCWLLFTSSAYSIRKIIVFNIALTVPIIIYTLTWSLLASPSVVLHNLFYDAYVQVGIDWYINIYLLCWNIALYHGPALFLLWPLTFVRFFSKSNSVNEQNVFILCFASIALLLFMTYKQPFPYNFVFTVPAFFLLYADFFTWWLRRPASVNLSTKSLINLSLYSISIFYVVNLLHLPLLYNAIALLPILACLFLSSLRKTRVIYFNAWLVLFLLTGILYPYYDALTGLSVLNGAYQRTMLQAAAELLDQNSDYVGGIPFLYQKDQPIVGLKNLIGPAIDYLYHPTEKLKPLLLASLYLAPSNATTVVHDLKKSHVKLFINNYRIVSLPPQISAYIKANYLHYYGSIYLYAPTITAAQQRFSLAFTSDYRVLGQRTMLIDGKKMKPGQMINLQQGVHSSQAQQAYRLMLVPPTQTLDPRYQQDEWVKMIKAIAT